MRSATGTTSGDSGRRLSTGGSLPALTCSASIGASFHLPACPAGPRTFVSRYPPFWARPAALELAALGRVRERLGVSTPDPLASGALTAPGAPWPYLVMSRLEGVELARVWPSLDPADQVSIAVRVGEVLARLHAVDARDLAGLAEPWPLFVQRRIERCLDRHAEHGASGSW